MSPDEIKAACERTMDLALDRLGQRVRGEWRVRPSGIHRCDRAQVLAARLDPAEVIQLPRKLALAFEVGTKTHEIVQGNLPEVPSEETWDSGVMIGHSDLRLVREGILIDLKTINVEGYIEVAKKGPKPEHVAQVTWYAVQSKSIRAAIVYVNKNGSIPAGLKAPKDLNPTYLVCPLPMSRESIAIAQGMDARAEGIISHVTNKTLPAYQEVLECRWCDHKAACHKALVEDARAAAKLVFRHINTKVVGTTFREGGPDWTTCEPGHPLELAWDKDNPHGPRRTDGTAQAVKVLLGGEHIGFLPATGSPTAEIVSDHLAAGGTASARVNEITGGGPGKNHGINIEIELHGSDF